MANQYIVYDAVKKYFQKYLIERDLAGTVSLVSDDIYSLGTGEHEVAIGKAEFRKLIEQEFKEIPMPIQFTIKDYREKQLADTVVQSFFNMQASLVLGSEKKVEFNTRFTGTFVKIEDCWLASSLHMSAPNDTQQSKEFFPLHYGVKQLDNVSLSSQMSIVERLMNIIPGGIMGGYVEPGFPLYVINDKMLSMLGYTYSEFIMETKGMMDNTMHPDDRDKVYNAVMSGIENNDEYEVEYRIKHKNGQYLWVYDIGRKIDTDDGRTAIISIISDISESISKREKLSQLAEHDGLTGLYNRIGGRQLIDKYFCSNSEYTFFMLDIDRFKKVNDIYGHQTGDRVLELTADILRKCFRGSDVIVRLGGDEFYVFVKCCCTEDNIAGKVDQLQQLYAEQAAAICPLSESGISLGIVYAKTAGDFDAIYRKADELLYRAKNDKANRYFIMELN